MKKRTKKRYTSAEQILADIERFKSKMQRHMDRAAAFDLTADEFVKYGATNPNDIPWHRERAKACRKSALRIEKDQLPRLKQRLAEFKTQTLPGIVPDGSIPR